MPARRSPSRSTSSRAGVGSIVVAVRVAMLGLVVGAVVLASASPSAARGHGHPGGSGTGEITYGGIGPVSESPWAWLIGMAVFFVMLAAAVTLFVLVVRALLKYLRSDPRSTHS